MTRILHLSSGGNGLNGDELGQIFRSLQQLTDLGFCDMSASQRSVRGFMIDVYP